jgi:hypothetical protein
MAETQNKPVIRIGKARKELLAKYATAAGFLYGVISVSEFVDLFNHYEDEKTTELETSLALERLAKTDDVEYSLFGDLISGPAFLPESPEDSEDAKIVRSHQKGKPRYLPAQNELLRYVEPAYREPEKPYADLKAFVLKHNLNPKEGLEGVDGDLIDLNEMIQSGAGTADILRMFDYPFKNGDEMNEFAALLSDVHNSTRLFENNGFTPSELFEKYERPMLKLLPDEPFIPSAVPKVGRNELCPCGSGLKYKKCHGR